MFTTQWNTYLRESDVAGLRKRTCIFGRLTIFAHPDEWPIFGNLVFKRVLIRQKHIAYDNKASRNISFFNWSSEIILFPTLTLTVDSSIDESTNMKDPMAWKTNHCCQIIPELNKEFLCHQVYISNRRKHKLEFSINSFPL